MQCSWKEVFLMKKHTAAGVIAGSLIAIALSALQPMIYPFSVMLCITPIALAVLYAWGGVIPAAILSVGTVGSLAGFAVVGAETMGEMAVSPVLAGMGALFALVLPGIVSVWLMEKRLPFFKRMLISVGVQTAALLGCVAYVYLVMKADLADMMTGMFRSVIDQQPIEVQKMLLQSFHDVGMLTKESVEGLTTGFVTPSDVRKAFDQVFELSNYQLKQTLPATLIGSGVLTGIMTTYFPSLISVKRGVEPVIPHVPLYGWFMPSHLVGGVTICLVSGIALQLMGNQSAMAVMVVFSLLASYLCIIQGMAAITRRFREVGAGKGARIGLIGASLVFAPTFLQYAGIASALFGRKGVVSTWMRKKMEEIEKDREDDDE